MLLFIFILVVVFYVVYSLIVGIGSSIFNSNQRPTFTDKTTHIHHHYHDNRTLNIDGKEFLNSKKDQSID